MKTDLILNEEKFLNKVSEFIHENGDYLFMGFVVFCIVAVVWLLSRQRKLPPPEPSSARTRAIIGTMLASPDTSTDADGGRTRLIMGKAQSRGTSSDSD